MPALLPTRGRPFVAAPPSLPGAADAYRRATCPSERTRALEGLALAVRAVALVASTRFANVRPAVREEIVQERTLRLVRHIVEGKATPGREIGLVRTSITNALRDHLRRKQRDVIEQSRPLDAAMPASRPAPPRERLASSFRGLIEEVRSPHHREVLRWTLLDERPLGELVERDLLELVDAGAFDATDDDGLERSRRRIRNRRDKHLQRAREALLRIVVGRHRDLLAGAPRELRHALVATYIERREPSGAVQEHLPTARRWLLRALLSIDG